jgi:hypothetical protein
MTAAAEVRMPLALIGESLGHLPFGLDRLSMTLFGELGNAWNPGDPERPSWLRSLGAEVVADVTYFYDAPLRLRAGVAVPLEAAPVQVYAALGRDF